jgi:hypothetical protein
LKWNPNLHYFLHWWWLWAWIYEINGEFLLIYIFRVSFRSFSNLFKVYASIHRLFVFVDLRWAFAMKTKKFLRITWFYLEIRTKRSLLKLLVSSGTENKSVILFFFFTDSKLLRSLFFSPQKLSVIVQFIAFVMNLGSNCRGSDSMMMIQAWVSENRNEFIKLMMNLISGILGFENCSLCSWNFCAFDRNWMERECEICLCDVARS